MLEQLVGKSHAKITTFKSHASEGEGLKIVMQQRRAIMRTKSILGAYLGLRPWDYS
jgi:hypothetical protein